MRRRRTVGGGRSWGWGGGRGGGGGCGGGEGGRRAQYSRRQYDGAERAFRQVVAGTPEAYLSQKGLGFVALERGDWAGAGEGLMESLTRNPHPVLTSYTLPAKRLLEAKQYGEAKELLGLGERVYPYAADVRWLLAKALLGREGEAGGARE